MRLAPPGSKASRCRRAAGGPSQSHRIPTARTSQYAWLEAGSVRPNAKCVGDRVVPRNPFMIRHADPHIQRVAVEDAVALRASSVLSSLDDQQTVPQLRHEDRRLHAALSTRLGSRKPGRRAPPPSAAPPWPTATQRPAAGSTQPSPVGGQAISTWMRSSGRSELSNRNAMPTTGRSVSRAPS